MRSGQIGSVVLLAVVALLVLRPWEGGSEATGPATASVRVVRAVDGDTLDVEIEGRRADVRLSGVDTPETVKPDEPVQCFGPQASAFTHRIADGRPARLLFGVERRDIYGRLLAYVQFGDPPLDVARRSLNAMLLRRGFARTLTFPPNDRFAAPFRRLELRAARAGRGLWDACGA